jgi:hypothetical protein
MVLIRLMIAAIMITLPCGDQFNSRIFHRSKMKI